MNRNIDRRFNTDANMVTVNENGRSNTFHSSLGFCASCGMWQNGKCCNSRSNWYKTPTTSSFSCNHFCG